MNPKRPGGIWRTRRPRPTEDNVRIHDGAGLALDMPESQYRARGYEPPFEELPWKEDDAAAQ